tara:strand:- start:9 stop:746 length:738 start_codon:yes stop_codon:yes gene_type:complete
MYLLITKIKTMEIELLEMTKQVSHAREVAKLLHKDQLYGARPYIEHLSEVYNIARRLTNNEDIWVAAWLHDALEDTKCSYYTIKEQFGEKVAELVYAVTDELGRDRQERKSNTYPKIFDNDDAITLKICDRIANFMACKTSLTEGGKEKFDMYSEEHVEFCCELRLASNTLNDANRRGFYMLENLSNIKSNYDSNFNYKIVSKFKEDNFEPIDTAIDEEDAIYMTEVYKLSLGSDFTVMYYLSEE